MLVPEQRWRSVVMHRRLKTAAIAGTFLIAGVAIGLAIPRTAQVTSGSGATSRPDHAAPRSTGRNVFSPDIRNDEHVRREQLKVVEMLEQQCRTARQNCELAAAARQALTRTD
jgi:hypothetical protein